MKTPSDSKLNEAVNLLCEYCQHHLADDYEVVLRMSKDDCSLDLIDPEGYDVIVDVDECGIRDVCDWSRDYAEETNDHL